MKAVQSQRLTPAHITAITERRAMFTRRHLLRGAAASGAYAGAASLLPAWAQNAHGVHSLKTQPPALTGPEFDLSIGRANVMIGGRKGHAVTVNGSLPAPLIRFREGERVTLNVHNTLDEDTSIHWHGLLVPFYMDGVPGVSFPGIKPGETFSYEFAVPQNGTYWYHSHSGLQEQSGLYGPIIIDPAGADPVSYDREYVLVLSDWLFEHPHKVYAKLKKNNEVFNMQERTLGDFIRDASDKGLGETVEDRAMWGNMRMSATDIADVTGAVYSYLINGHSTEDNWTALFETGERIRLRIINAAAMTIFNFRIPGLPMTVVQADGLHVQPVDTDEIQIGVAETYDVIVEPKRARPFAIVAEAIDRFGQAVATLSPRTEMRATAPLLRERPILTHKDMAMDHGGMAHDGHAIPKQAHNHKMGVGVDMVAEMPTNRLNEPGLGLENVPHRTLRYTQLKSTVPNPDLRAPEREIEIHLTGNMERFMWGFDGVKFSAIEKPFTLYEGERVRFTLVNDTMMTHPIHLHGMFFDLNTEESDHRPRKHTVNVKPGEKLSFDVTADHVGDWAFHCHLLFHMHAGMMQVVSVLPKSEGRPPPYMDHEGHDTPSPASHDAHKHEGR